MTPGQGISTDNIYLSPGETTEENLSAVTATVDQEDPLRAICKSGKTQRKTCG